MLIDDMQMLGCECSYVPNARCLFACIASLELMVGTS